MMKYKILKISGPIRSIVLTVGMGLLLCGCNQEAKKRSTSAGNATVFQTPVQKRIRLDSTVLGVGTILTDLDVPWEIAWGPDNWIWFTEQGGRVSRVNPATGQKVVLLDIPEVFRKRTTGLMGMALHPDMGQNPYVFLTYTFKIGDSIKCKLVRYTYTGQQLEHPKILLVIPGSTSHNGTRLTISPEGKVIWATGDIGPETDNAQDLHSLNGKILRLNSDGSIPRDNPFPGSPIWSWGHRNHQGLVYGKRNNLYTSEHGEATDDEINRITKGGNYGWPEVEGYCNRPEERDFCGDSIVVPPLKAWTPTIAPAGLDFYSSSTIPEWQNSLLLVTLKENDLRVLKLNEEGTAVVSESVLLDEAFGRLRDICLAPNGDVYISTSNRDWNPREGYPKKGDDRIIRLFKINEPDKRQIIALQEQETNMQTKQGQFISKGHSDYEQYCASCHKSNGSGISGTFPSLKGSSLVLGDKKELIQIILKGESKALKEKGGEYDQSMPAFQFLKDEEIAEIVMYIRSHFGKDTGKITTSEVHDIRENLGTSKN